MRVLFQRSFTVRIRGNKNKWLEAKITGGKNKGRGLQNKVCDKVSNIGVGRKKTKLMYKSRFY